jgi:hypothetical protein
MISNELNLFKRVWIRGMERLCFGGMDQDLKWAAAIWVPMDTLSLDMSGHTAGRPNRWLLLTGSRDRLWPPDEVMLIIIPNRAIPWTQQLGWSMALGLQHFKEAYLLPWMNVWTLRWLSISRTRNRDITKKLAGVCTEKLEYPVKPLWGWPLAHYICIYIYRFPVSSFRLFGFFSSSSSLASSLRRKLTTRGKCFHNLCYIYDLLIFLNVPLYGCKILPRICSHD